jgi:hypothetical protein
MSNSQRPVMIFAIAAAVAVVMLVVLGCAGLIGFRLWQRSGIYDQHNAPVVTAERVALESLSKYGITSLDHKSPRHLMRGNNFARFEVTAIDATNANHLVVVEYAYDDLNHFDNLQVTRIVIDGKVVFGPQETTIRD